eukprot:GHVP01055073.1.p2 GENE.GHVP01055073.1~~GHVP01055073.1.p2  ORF type:complete len:178 (-),score=39.36 GHVP01055073.1:37-570(-)
MSLYNEKSTQIVEEYLKKATQDLSRTEDKAKVLEKKRDHLMQRLETIKGLNIQHQNKKERTKASLEKNHARQLKIERLKEELREAETLYEKTAQTLQEENSNSQEVQRAIETAKRNCTAKVNKNEALLKLLESSTFVKITYFDQVVLEAELGQKPIKLKVKGDQAQIDAVWGAISSV